MNIEHFKLGTRVLEKASQIQGMLTQLEVQEGGNMFYLLQPRGINPETHEMLDQFWLAAPRIDGGQVIESDIPVEVLGTEVTDEASGFAGRAIGLNLHVSGCVHISIQPPGKQKNGNKIKIENIDMRRCSGPAIPVMTEEEVVADKKKKPSPDTSNYQGPMDR